MADCYPDSPAFELETVFGLIEATRMAGVPLLNPALRVEAIGFRRWSPGAAETDLAGELWAGVMLTPWFMNLMLLPALPGTLPPVPPGGEIRLALPGGDMPFLAGHEAGLGHYCLCSLFSPVTEFADQDTARETALEILRLMFPPPPPAHAPDLSRRRLFGLGA
ncbi:[NiFe]-hydrogenase assembly chaperone HybE [uncultured Aquitalea sp.]|uniref:[NiFe]-hydrogenase assembly chaperone HybE n=1 Tax=uncultured Aquitalea sp. TaxID=540272 RepID=UPI0025E3D04F|nr:[NiFe]-hydrogenase assembly chaperone HybE [uncultured Aquitalea sp.]